MRTLKNILFQLKRIADALDMLCTPRKQADDAKNSTGMRHNKTWSKWSNAEVSALKKLYRQGVPDAEIARLINRTASAIQSKRVELGLTH